MMRWLKALPALALSILSSAGGCSLAVDSSDIDARCPSGTKYCDNRCVDDDDPRYGCKSTSCTACEQPNSIPICKDQTCQPGACLRGFGCPDCSINIFIDSHNCGECGHACDAGKVCHVGECSDPE